MLVLSIALALAAATPESTYEITGNRAVPTSVYLYLLERKEAARGAPLPAEDVERRLGRYLRAAGFPFAEVSARSEGGKILVLIDEGTVEQVIFPGAGGLQAIIAQTVFRLDDDVYNELAFAQACERLEEMVGTRVLGHEMRRVETDDQVAPFQVGDIEAVRELMRLRTGRYVLSIELEQSFMSPGWGIGLGSNGPDGLVFELRHRWKDGLLEDDRIVVGGEVGLRVGELLGGGDKPALSRAGLRARWLSPELGPPLRAEAFLRPAYLNRQRLDLDGSTYDLFEPEGGLGLVWVGSQTLEAYLQLGLQERILYAPSRSDRARPTTTGKLRGFAELRLDWLAGESLRRDHRLELELVARGFAVDQPYVDLLLRLAKSLPIGAYSDVRLSAKGQALAGGFGLLDEYRVSDSFHGLYGDSLYATRLAKAEAELFLSLEREFLRISGFVSGIALETTEFAVDEPEAQPGVAGGIGLHGLVFSTFQASLYGVVGIIGDRELATSVTFSLMRMF